LFSRARKTARQRNQKQQCNSELHASMKPVLVSTVNSPNLERFDPSVNVFDD
jgi:hypothetical protein